MTHSLLKFVFFFNENVLCTCMICDNRVIQILYKQCNVYLIKYKCTCVIDQHFVAIKIPLFELLNYQ